MENHTRTKKVFTFEKLEKHRQQLSDVVKKKFNKQILILTQLIKCQTTLTDMFLKHLYVKEHLGLSFRSNFLLTHSLLTQPMLSSSALLLVENGFYGSSRVLLRQNFEFLIISKYAELDNSIISRWKKKNEGKDRNNEINITNDVFNKLESKVRVYHLKDSWVRLCDFCHATHFAQQPPLLPSFEKDSEHIPNAWYTLDLIFMTIVMSLHLTNILHTKARRFYLGYEEDPFGDYKKIRTMKKKIKKLISDYYMLNISSNINTRKVIGPTIREFKARWE
ncbi:MAG: hypothetical protein WC350_03830 [Candidatus Micrarchaeia archaeon]|jgi:hypothetical protein